MKKERIHWTMVHGQVELKNTPTLGVAPSHQVILQISSSKLFGE
jgi:hypothetical protein